MRRPTAPQALSLVVGLSSWENNGDSACTERPTVPAACTAEGGCREARWLLALQPEVQTAQAGAGFGRTETRC